MRGEFGSVSDLLTPKLAALSSPPGGLPRKLTEYQARQRMRQTVLSEFGLVQLRGIGGRIEFWSLYVV